MGFSYNYAKMAAQHYFIQNFMPFDIKIKNRNLNLTYKYQMQSRPLGSMYSSVVENLKKQSFLFKLDL